MASRKGPLLAPGNEVEWAQINAEEDRQEAEMAAALSVAERLESGQNLCDQAFKLYNAVHGGEDGPQRDPRT